MMRKNLAAVMGGYQKNNRYDQKKKSYRFAKSILLITPVDRKRHPRVLFDKEEREMSKEDPNRMKFRFGNRFGGGEESEGEGEVVLVEDGSKNKAMRDSSQKS